MVAVPWSTGQGAMTVDVPVTLFVRPLPGLVGERDRMVHVVPLSTDDSVPAALAAYCGLRFAPRTTEALPGPRGMPASGA